MKKINIVSVWTWFCNILDTQSLSASEQLIMVHLIKIFNRNFWKPTQISTSALCRSCGKDARTVKRSISLLKTANLITETEEGLFLKFEEDDIKEKPQRRTANQPSLTKKTAKPRSSATTRENTTTKLGMSYMVTRIAEEWKKEGVLSETYQEIFNRLPLEEKERVKFIVEQNELNI